MGDTHFNASGAWFFLSVLLIPSAALLAQNATGRAPHSVEDAAEALEQWLAGEGALPDWPGIAALAPARDHPGRHGALLLPWTAARMALSQASGTR